MSDPINRVPTNSITLFEKFARDADGFQADQVICAALNIVCNAIRQVRDTRHDAELTWDEFTTKAKGNLMDCYDSTGRKKGVYPYHQIIKVPFSDFRET